VIGYQVVLLKLSVPKAFLPASFLSVPLSVNPGFHPEVLQSVEVTQVPELRQLRRLSVVDTFPTSDASR
jgi:hypothetical protein